MMLAELILAAGLLTGDCPAEMSDPAHLRAAFPSLRISLVHLALEYEILDPRETRYVLARRDDFSEDLQMVQRRWEELADAPPLADSYRFPDRALVNELLVFNRAHRNYVEMRRPMELGNSGYLRNTQREVDHLYQIWDTVRDARCEYYYVTVRRQALLRLRDMLGEENYYAGILPPHVPLWRFQEIE